MDAFFDGCEKGSDWMKNVLRMNVNAGIWTWSSAMCFNYFDDWSSFDGLCMDVQVRFKPKMVHTPPTANKASFCTSVCHEVSASVVCSAYHSTSDDRPMMSMVNALVLGALSCMGCPWITNGGKCDNWWCVLYLSNPHEQIFLTFSHHQDLGK